MTKYDAVLFDLDGTLTRSEPGITNSVQYALEQMGRAPLPLNERLKFIGPPLYESFRQLAGMSEGDAHKAVEKYRERFSEIGWKENSVYEGIPDMLRLLKREGVYLAVASAKPQAFVEKILVHFGLRRFFDRVEAIQLSDQHADKAEIVKRALPPGCQRAAMVGDRKYDMEGARAVGLSAVGVSYGYGSREELKAAGAHAVCATAEQLSRELGCEGSARGALITFEGVDGCGKTTQMKNAIEFLTERGYRVISSREPGGCPISERVRDIILDRANMEMTPMCEALLYAASRAQHVETLLRPALAEGKVAVCDRYLDSSLVYQGLGRGLGVDNVAAINQYATGGLEPDLTLLFDMSPQAALARRGGQERDRLESAPDEFREKVRGGYLELARSCPHRIAVIQAAAPREQVWREARAALENWLDRRL